MYQWHMRITGNLEEIITKLSAMQAHRDDSITSVELREKPQEPSRGLKLTT